MTVSTCNIENSPRCYFVILLPNKYSFNNCTLSGVPLFQTLNTNWAKSHECTTVMHVFCFLPFTKLRLIVGLNQFQSVDVLYSLPAVIFRKYILLIICRVMLRCLDSQKFDNCFWKSGVERGCVNDPVFYEIGGRVKGSI